MDIEYIREYLVMAQESNYTEAADKLFLSQSTLFKHIKALESELGVPLFEKTGRRIAITPYGKVFAEYAEQIVTLSNRCLSDIQKLKETESNLIELSADYRVQDIIRDFCYLNKGYVIHTHPGDAKKLLASGECSLALLLRGLETKEDEKLLEEFEWKDVGTESLAAVIPASHPLASRKSVTLKELEKEDIITVNTKYDLGVRLFEQNGLSPRVVMNALVGTEAAELVEDESGIAILHKKSIASKFEEDLIRLVDLDPPVNLTLSIAWRKGAHLTGAEKKFIDFLGEYFKDF